MAAPGQEVNAKEGKKNLSKLLALRLPSNYRNQYLLLLIRGFVQTVRDIKQNEPGTLIGLH